MKQLFSILSLTLLLLSCAEKTQQPNIIFILTDDQRWDALAYAGNTIIETPEMDKLAMEGTYFSHAFVTTPICAASRASLFSGLYERTHGYTFEQGAMHQKYMAASYPQKLRQAGYHTAFFGKFGVNYPALPQLFDQVDRYDINYKSTDSTGYFFKEIDGKPTHLTRYLGHQALTFLDTISSDKPFALSLSFSAPHALDNVPTQYFWQEKSNDRYANVTIPDPQLEEDKYFEQLPKEVREGFNRLRWGWRYDTPEKYQHSVKGYYRMISEVDEEIGAIRALLEKKGLADNTVIVFMGDNGYYLGERQLAGKWLMHDNSLRVPMVIYDPRVKQHYDVDDMVLNVDITKTMVELTGLSAPESYQGISLLPYVNTGVNESYRRSSLFEHLWDKSQIPSSEGIRTEQWKYFRYRLIDAPEELYNIEIDPLETNNLALNPEYESVLVELRLKMEQQAQRYTDEK